MATLGLLAAIGALLFWAVGDYSIEQATRKIGNLKTLFFIGAAGFIGLLPFIVDEIPELYLGADIKMLVLLGLVGFVSAIFIFEALKEGKLSIIEPVFGIELPVVILLSIFIGKENLDWIFYLLSALVFAGIILAVTRWEHLKMKHKLLEKGVWFAIIGSIGMGVTDFLTGTSVQTISPMLIIWYLHSFIGLAALICLFIKGQKLNLIKDLKENPKPIISVAIFDNFAWVFYAYSMVYLPISIATTITESFIALTVLIGVFVNKEKIQRHQVIGIIVVIIAVLLIAYLVEY